MLSRCDRCRSPIRSELVEVRIVGSNRGFGINSGRYPQLTRPVWQELRNQQQALDGMFAWGTYDLRVGERTDLRPANGIFVSGEYFSTLGVKPHRGRLIQAADELAPVRRPLPWSATNTGSARWEPPSWGLDPPSRQHGSLRCRWRCAARILRRCRRRVIRYRAADVSAERAARARCSTSPSWEGSGPDGRSSARPRTWIRSAPAFSTRWRRRRTAHRPSRASNHSGSPPIRRRRASAPFGRDMRTRCSSCLPSRR